ncbi:MAG: hypothetical protein OEY44_04165 [Candidatus Peregrinibacteria bacterium]|nr:hypothetical protein [Candidatus Peregrinibacteria bacterium]
MPSSYPPPNPEARYSSPDANTGSLASIINLYRRDGFQLLAKDLREAELSHFRDHHPDTELVNFEEGPDRFAVYGKKENE